MKTLRTTLLAFLIGFIVPATAEPVDAPSNLLKIGKSFQFKVKSMTSSKADVTGFTPSGVPIPAGIPKYKIGKTIAFKVTKGNQLQWPDRSLPLYGDYDGFYSYSKIKTANNLYPDVANVYVNAKDKPTRVIIYFYKKTKSGAIHTVEYQLE
jgi:hypothetical protein